MASYLRACRGQHVLLVLRDGRVLEGRLLHARRSYALRDPDAVVVAARAEGEAAVAISLSLSMVAAVIPAPAFPRPRAGGPGLAGGEQR